MTTQEISCGHHDATYRHARLFNGVGVCRALTTAQAGGPGDARLVNNITMAKHYTLKAEIVI